MVYGGVNSPPKKLVLSLRLAPSALFFLQLKVMTLTSSPRLFAPPGSTDKITLTNYRAQFRPTLSPTNQTSARLFIF